MVRSHRQRDAGYLSKLDIHTPGPRYDVTPLFADASAFAQLLDDLLAHVQSEQADLVAGIDALGFILGAALAIRLGVGFVPIRKGGKLPVDVDHADFVDYSGQAKTLEMRRDVIAVGARVLLVDDWIETGTQVMAAIALIEDAGGVIVGVAAIGMDETERTRPLRERYDCFSVWRET